MQITHRGLIALGAVAGAVVLWLGIDFFWVTDQEKIEAVLDRLAEAIASGDTGAVMALVSDDYYIQGMNRTGLERIVRGYFRRCGPTAVWYLHRSPTDIAGNRLVTEVVVYSQSAMTSPYYLHGRSRWRLSFKKHGKDWLIVRIEPLQFGIREVAGWADVPQFSDE